MERSFRPSGRFPVHPRESELHAGDSSHGSARVRTPGKKPGGDGPSAHPLLALQNSAGNAAVVQMLRQEGHAWAQPEQHLHDAGCGHQQTGQPQVQRSAVHDVLRSGGSPMNSGLREEMEARLGADFSQVRIHDDSAARASAAEVGARAYTSGHHVVIGDGGGDKHTLAHELTHVIQQRQGPVSGTDTGSGLRMSDPSDAYEQAAEQNARQVMSAPLPVQRRASADRENPGPESSPAEETPVQRAPDWKNNPTKNALAAQKAAHPGDALVHTLHHIVPKSLLEQFARLLSPAQLTQVVNALQPHAPSAFTTPQASLGAVSKALKNLPANFALGPEPAGRSDDPGSSGPDLNYSTEDGSITPRSEQLERVYEFIDQQVNAGGPVAPGDLQTRFIAPLIVACQEHALAIARDGLSGPVGLDPNRTRWLGDAATRTQHRNGMLEPLV
ncbi:protein of unknown function [Streptomyces prasinopilosus]|uniref:eCIS core domain-containing protein n=1 Tax=Streptomyces prasinopilosus TaxID=67344 RepID=A0A1G6I2T9_9ACTN|nr:protein of unknown function [Streptomyces prasinopilosus]